MKDLLFEKFKEFKINPKNTNSITGGKTVLIVTHDLGDGKTIEAVKGDSGYTQTNWDTCQ